jgi:hypothetical protein
MRALSCNSLSVENRSAITLVEAFMAKSTSIEHGVLSFFEEERGAASNFKKNKGCQQLLAPSKTLFRRLQQPTHFFGFFDAKPQRA